MSGCAARCPGEPDDRRGALNHLGPAQIQAAASEVRLGRTVSLAAPVEHQVSADNPDPAQYRMVQAPGAAADGLEFAADRIAMNIHGNADSHIDALCHVSLRRHPLQRRARQRRHRRRRR